MDYFELRRLVPKPIEKPEYWYETIVRNPYATNKEYYIRILRYLGSGTNVVVPSEIDDWPVEEIYYNAFSNLPVETVELPDTLKTIC